MTKIITILGRQPALGLAELESLLGAEKVQPLGLGAAVVEAEPQDFPMQRLGGTMKAARYLTDLPYTDWDKIEEYLIQELPKHTCCRPPGKIRLGLNAYGFKISLGRINATGLTLKRVVKNPPDGEGRSVRVVPNNATELNTAQIIHNQLLGPTGFDLVLIKNGGKTILAQTFAVQDIDAYAARDQKRPKRDARVGMLPPKLAQLIINLAVGQTGSNEQRTMNKELNAQSSSLTALHDKVVLDPFCGTGVVLQEALLMGYPAYGTDLEPRMIEYSTENLHWLTEKYDDIGSFQVESGDATDYQWSGFDTVACETYLGRPFTGIPTPPVLKKVIQDVDTIHRKFLKNLAAQTKQGFRACIAVPAWRTNKSNEQRATSGEKNPPLTAHDSKLFKHLPVLDSLEELGYTRMSFAHVSNEDLLYHRADQIVARELVVLIRK